MSAYAYPSAHLIHPLNPPRRLITGLTGTDRLAALAAHADAWHLHRSEGIGASAASTLGGFNPHSSLTQLYAEKVHGYRPDAGPAAEIGTDLEPSIRARFTERTGLSLRRVGMLAHNDHPWARCNPDALTSDGGGLEIKTTTDRDNGWEWDAEPADHAMAQAQWSMLVTGLPHWWIAVRFRDTGEMKLYKVPADPGLQAMLFTRARTFWFSHVQTLTPPPVDGTPATRSALEATYIRPATRVVEGGEPAARLRRNLERVNAEIAALQARKEALTNEAKAMLGSDGDELTAHGVPVLRWRANGNFAHAKWAKEHPEEAEEYTTPTPVLDTKRALAESATARDFIGRRFTTVKLSGERAALVGLEPSPEAAERMERLERTA